MNERYIDTMGYLLVDSVAGGVRRSRASDTRIIALKRAEKKRTKKARVNRTRWDLLWKNLLGRS